MYFDKRKTKAGEIEYAVPVLTASGDTAEEKLADIENHYAETAPEISITDVLVRAWQECQTGGSMQGSKGGVRGASEDDLPEAIEGHQAKSETFLYGKASPRSAGGLTNARKQDIGAALVSFRKSEGRSPSDEEMDEILEKHGLSIS